MRLFVIHRFADRRCAKKVLKKLLHRLSIKAKFIFLDSSGSSQWKQKAENAINEAEAVIVFKPESCVESKNATWELEKAKDLGRKIIEIYADSTNKSGASMLTSLYDLEEEFANCFSLEDKDVFGLYKMMVDSSEQLIQRRQKTNAFFITVISSLLAIAGLLAKTGTINGNSAWILGGFSIAGLFLCNSWRNLIDNYGKLNKAKYDVILRLEKDLNAQVFSAEWIALGKGLRPKKYQSFTSTEKNVPLVFAFLIVVLTIIALWHIASN